MAQYLVTYLIGDAETIEANKVAHDHDGEQYVFHKQDRAYAPVALVPAANVLSIVRQDDEAVDPCGAPAGAICVHDLSGSRKAVDA